jgi:predicted  nucleic acid-binding Zn-ribbon protein
MTPTRYFISRITRAFGLNRRNQRMSDAATEMHLLRDAEAFLGATLWEKTEKIEKLSSEYWNLRKLAKERETVEARLVECQERLNKAHEERAALLNVVSEPEKDLSEERTRILTRLSALALRRDEVIASAKEIRHNYDGLKVKSEVLAGQTGDSKPSAEEFEKIKASLTELKGRFSALKDERQKIADEIEKGDAEIDAISDKIRDYKKIQYDHASKAFQVIGDANKEISSLRAEFGMIDSKMVQLHGEIGRHVSRNTSLDPVCAEAARGQTGLIDVMRALRKSITLNHKLSEQ